MTRHTARVVDRFEDLYDRDIETLISGGTPANTDLLPLRAFVAELRAIADQPIDEEFIRFHASESAASVASRRGASASPTQPRPSLWLGIRRRLTTAAVSLTMLIGATGMAWAADGAAPGDWNYGLDLALEAIGIGAGGDAERAEEMRATSPGQLGGSDDSAEPDDGVGTNAVEVETPEPTPDSARFYAARAHTSGLLQYLHETEKVDGGVVSDLARERPTSPQGNGPPEDRPGQGHQEKPERGKAPESPGNSGRP